MASGTGKYRYKTDKGNLFYARTDDSPDLASIRGAEPSGNVTENITFKVSKSSKEVGFKPRQAILALQGTQSISGCLVNPNNVTKRVVILDPATVLPQRGTVLTVNGRSWVLTGYTTEHSR